MNLKKKNSNLSDKTEHKRFHLKKKTIFIMTGVIIVSIVGITVYVKMTTKSSLTTNTATGNNNRFNSGFSDRVSSTGYAAYGTINQLLDISATDSKYMLVVDKVLVESGDEVKKGDALLSVTDDSYTTFQTYLTQKVQEAKNDLKTQEMDYNQAKLEAEYQLLSDTRLSDKSLITYNEEVSALQDAVDVAKTNLEDANTAVSENPDTISANKKTIATYESKITSLENTLKGINSSLTTSTSNYKKARSTYLFTLKEYVSVLYTYQYIESALGNDTTDVKKQITNVEDQISSLNETSESSSSSSTSSSSSSSSGSGQNMPSQSGMPNATGVSSLSDSSGSFSNLSVSNTQTITLSSTSDDMDLDTLIAQLESDCTSLSKEYTTDKKAYEAAKSEKTKLETKKASYTDSMNSCQDKISVLEKANEELQSSYNKYKSEISSLQLAYTNALNDQVTSLITIKKDYQDDVVTSESAQTTYDKTLAELETTYQSYVDALSTAKENLALLTSGVKNLKICATQDGTLSSVGYSTDDTITATTPIVTYSDKSKVTITVSVDQGDVGSINVGDSVSVMGSGRFFGTVDSISSEAQSESLSNVTYDVVISLEVDENTSISTSDSMTVNFGSPNM